MLCFPFFAVLFLFLSLYGWNSECICEAGSEKYKFAIVQCSTPARPRGYKTGVQSQTQNKAQ